MSNPITPSWWELNNRSLPVHDPYELARAVAERFAGHPPQQADAGFRSALQSVAVSLFETAGEYELEPVGGMSQADRNIVAGSLRRIGYEALEHIKAALPAPPAPAYTEEELKKWWLAECSKCGWKGLSRDAKGGGALGDSGDYDAVICPECIQRAKIVPVDAVDAPAAASEQPSPDANAVDPGEGWRLLDEEKDHKQPGDQLLCFDGSWRDVEVPVHHPETMGFTYRRRITAQAEQGGAV